MCFIQVIEKERRGDYMGKTVQTIPHVTDTIVQWVERVAQIPVDGTDCRPDVCIIEVCTIISLLVLYLNRFSWVELSETLRECPSHTPLSVSSLPPREGTS